MEGIVDMDSSLPVSDEELSELLWRVYVEGGYTHAEVAKSLFEPSAIRKRGELLVVREPRGSNLAGMVIVVGPDSDARRLATDNEVEMHLLAVKPEYRGKGLGGTLIAAAVETARRQGHSKMLLATQSGMGEAQRLYSAAGFHRVPQRDFSRNGSDFLVYERTLNA